MKTTWLGLLTWAGMTALAAPLPTVSVGDLQPFRAQVLRVMDALEVMGAPLSTGERSTIESALQGTDPALAAAKVQSVLDSHVLLGVHINPEMRVNDFQNRPTPIVDGGKPVRELF